MSSILEALKKLDRERTERTAGVINIEREILKAPSQGGGKKSRHLTLFLTLIAMVVVLLILLVFWWGPFSGRDSSKGKESVRYKVTAPDASRTGRLPMPESLGQVPAADQKAALPVPAEKGAVPQIPPTVIEPAPEGRSAQAVVKPGPVVSSPPTQKAPVAPAPAPPPRKKPETVSKRLPSLAVTGIAFAGSRKSRLAIINDQTVSIGENIEGAKVEDISEEAVSFSWQGRKFTLGVGESTRDR